MKMIKYARVNTLFDDEDVYDYQQLGNFINEDEVGTSNGDVGHNIPFNDVVNVIKKQIKV